MSESRTVPKIAEKIVEILDVFDLSFFISGAVASAALLVHFEAKVDIKLAEHTGLSIFGLVVGSYVLGLVCFAVGRPLRQVVHRSVAQWWAQRQQPPGSAAPTPRTGEILYEALRAQGLVDGPTAPEFAEIFAFVRPADPGALSKDDGLRLSRLYTRLWAHVRSFEGLQESFSLLKRYWVLSASYDGIAIAVLVWLLPIWSGVHAKVGPVALASLWTLLIVGALVASWHRAREYKRYQIEELVATVAHWMSLAGRPVLRALRGEGSSAEAPVEQAESPASHP